MKQSWIFDSEGAMLFVKRRQEFFNQFLPKLIQSLHLKNVLDVGCGVGIFSNYLADFGLTVTAIDGREENIIEARKRYPNINFQVWNVEDPQMKTLGKFDLVFCVGLLYHLENLFRTIRNLHALTEKVLIAESIVIPTPLPFAALIDETTTEDQSLNYIAFIASEAGLAKMFLQSGFQVYRTTKLPNHLDFRETFSRKRLRTILVAAKTDLPALPFLQPMKPLKQLNLWGKPLGGAYEQLRLKIKAGSRMLLRTLGWRKALR